MENRNASCTNPTNLYVDGFGAMTVSTILSKYQLIQTNKYVTKIKVTVDAKTW